MTHSSILYTQLSVLFVQAESCTCPPITSEAACFHFSLNHILQARNHRDHTERPTFHNSIKNIFKIVLNMVCYFPSNSFSGNFTVAGNLLKRLYTAICGDCLRLFSFIILSGNREILTRVTYFNSIIFLRLYRTILLYC